MKQRYFAKLVLDGKELIIELGGCISRPQDYISPTRTLMVNIQYGWKNYSYRFDKEKSTYVDREKDWNKYCCWRYLFELRLLEDPWTISEEEFNSIDPQRKTICYIDTDEHQWAEPKKTNWRFTQLIDRGEDKFFNEPTHQFALQDLLQ